MQISIPLNFIGFLYREIRQGLADIESMFDLLLVPAEIKDMPECWARSRPSRDGIAFRNVRFPLRCRPADPERRRF